VTDRRSRYAATDPWRLFWAWDWAWAWALAAFSLVILIEWQTHGTKKKNPQQNPLIFCRQFGGQLPRQSDFFESLVFLFTLRFVGEFGENRFIADDI